MCALARNDRETDPLEIVFDGLRRFPLFFRVWVKSGSDALTQTVFLPKWRKNAIFEAFLEAKHPVFARKPGASGIAGQKRYYGVMQVVVSLRNYSEKNKGLMNCNSVNYKVALSI